MTTRCILVTGATGFIGRHVVQKLLAEDRQLTLLVRDLRLCPAAWLQQPRIKISQIPDLTVESRLGETVAESDAIIHLAGLAHVASADRNRGGELFTRANAEVTHALTQAAAASGIKTFIHLSSLASITTNATDAIIDDGTDETPTTPYGRSKRDAESHVRQLAETGIFAVSLRPPLVVGAHARGNWASLQALAATGIPLPFASVDNRRSFIGIRTLTEAISTLCSRQWSPSAAGDYCIADPEPLSLPEVVRLLREGMNKPARLFRCPTATFDLIGGVTGRRRQISGLTGNLRVDASRFHETFDFQPSQQLPDAIRQSGQEYLADMSR